jgi:mono/diheme cytochrome c family protein
MTARHLAVLVVWDASTMGITGSAPVAADSGDRNVGAQIAARACVGCHGVGGATGVTIQGVYVPSFSEIARRPNQSRERLQAFVMIPRHPMPGLPLEEREIRHLAEYIYSLRD